MVHPIWSSVLVADQIFQIGKVHFSVNLEFYRFVNASTFLKIKFMADMIKGFAQRSASFTQEAAVRKCSSEKFRNIPRKAPVLESFFNKVAGPSHATLSKRDSSTGIFL